MLNNAVKTSSTGLLMKSIAGLGLALLLVVICCQLAQAQPIGTCIGTGTSIGRFKWTPILEKGIDLLMSGADLVLDNDAAKHADGEKLLSYGNKLLRESGNAEHPDVKNLLKCAKQLIHLLHKMGRDERKNDTLRIDMKQFQTQMKCINARLSQCYPNIKNGIESSFKH